MVQAAESEGRCQDILRLSVLTLALCMVALVRWEHRIWAGSGGECVFFALDEFKCLGEV